MRFPRRHRNPVNRPILLGSEEIVRESTCEVLAGALIKAITKRDPDAVVWHRTLHSSGERFYVTVERAQPTDEVPRPTAS